MDARHSAVRGESVSPVRLPTTVEANPAELLDAGLTLIELRSMSADKLTTESEA